jgi:hypothetical protein
MFAPDHAATASELAPVVATGGQIALANWTPEGGVGQMFKMMVPFLPPPARSSVAASSTAAIVAYRQRRLVEHQAA